MFNKPLERKIRTPTQTQLHQYSISIQLGEKVTPDPAIRGASLKKPNFFRPFGPQFGLKLKAAGPPNFPLSDPPPCGHVTGRSCVEYSVWGQSRSVV